jgi:ATP-binding cassette, subfamily C (CFTR/MRP), member 1
MLQRAQLLPRDFPDPTADKKFSLDSAVSDEGSNFSAGEKQLLALCRALVKNSRIIVLVRQIYFCCHVSNISVIQDEPTSNVDVETDAKLQRTIQVEFAASTLLCIAHRLNTIGNCFADVCGPKKLRFSFSAYYDRVLVMDAGEIAEFDTVLNLYDNEASIFRSLCNEANLQRADILRIRADHRGTDASLN